jgi:YCII-related domain
MAEFIFTYRTPAGYTPGTPDGIAAWTAWFQSMGSQLRELGKPVFNRATVGDGADGAVLGGYSLVTAENLDEALTLAKGCPIVAAGGGVEVGELANLPT